MSENVEVFVYLENEGVDVWRPTSAENLGGDRYLLHATPGYDPELENWEFTPGSVVVCQMRQFQGEPEPKLVAVSAS